MLFYALSSTRPTTRPIGSHVGQSENQQIPTPLKQSRVGRIVGYNLTTATLIIGMENTESRQINMESILLQKYSNNTFYNSVNITLRI